MTVDRATYDRIRQLIAQGLSQGRVARELGVDRFIVQTVLRVQSLPAHLQHAFLADRLTQADILALDRGRRDGNLTDVWSIIHAGGSVDIYPKVSAAKVKRAIVTTRNSIVRDTLRWVLGELDRLPV